MTALTIEARLQPERIVHDSEKFQGVTGGRDLIGFMRRRRGRLELAGHDRVELVKADGLTVYAVIDGRRLGFTSARQFERAGFRWDDVRELAPAELEAIPDDGQLELWE